LPSHVALMTFGGRKKAEARISVESKCSRKKKGEDPSGRLEHVMKVRRTPVKKKRDEGGEGGSKVGIKMIFFKTVSAPWRSADVMGGSSFR